MGLVGDPPSTIWHLLRSQFTEQPLIQRIALHPGEHNWGHPEGHPQTGPQERLCGSQMRGGGSACIDLARLAKVVHQALYSSNSGLRREQCLCEIPGQAGAYQQENERTPKGTPWRWAECESWIGHEGLEARGGVDLGLAHGFQKEATAKEVAQRRRDLEERTTGSFGDEARTRERIAERRADEGQKPGREEPERRQTQRGKGAIGVLLDPKGQINAEALIRSRRRRREGERAS